MFLALDTWQEGGERRSELNSQQDSTMTASPPAPGQSSEVLSWGCDRGALGEHSHCSEV